jgi:hypothetical protein
MTTLKGKVALITGSGARHRQGHRGTVRAAWYGRGRELRDGREERSRNRRRNPLRRRFCHCLAGRRFEARQHRPFVRSTIVTLRDIA